MTIRQAIAAADRIKPNDYTNEDKIRWLSELDGKVTNDIINTHEGGEDTTFTAYTESTDDSTVLLIPEPYSEVYLYWLFSKIDLFNGETDRYNNDMILYNNAYVDYANFFNRTNMPVRVDIDVGCNAESTLAIEELDL